MRQTSAAIALHAHATAAQIIRKTGPMRLIIWVDDLHVHGGRVESVAATSKVMRRAVARVSDTCSYPIHGTCPIADGDPQFNVEGRAAAFDAHETSCGAALISSLPHSGRT